jgi:hypothetical protein
MCNLTILSYFCDNVYILYPQCPRSSQDGNAPIAKAARISGSTGIHGCAGSPAAGSMNASIAAVNT